jgi:hypothetical protein
MNKKLFDYNQFLFVGVLVLFLMSTVYSLGSFYLSTDEYIKASVVDVPVLEDVSGELVLPNLIFEDVDFEHKNSVALRSLKDKGLISGDEKGGFYPDRLISRAELMKFLTMALEVNFAEREYVNCFSDVGEEWFAESVCFGKEQGWVNGYDDGHFGPNDKVTYAIALKIVLQAFDFEVEGLESSKGAWYTAYFNAALNHGVIFGDEFFEAEKEISRADFMELVYRALKA